VDVESWSDPHLAELMSIDIRRSSYICGRLFQEIYWFENQLTYCRDFVYYPIPGEINPFFEEEILSH